MVDNVLRVSCGLGWVLGIFIHGCWISQFRNILSQLAVLSFTIKNDGVSMLFGKVRFKKGRYNWLLRWRVNKWKKKYQCYWRLACGVSCPFRRRVRPAKHCSPIVSITSLPERFLESFHLITQQNLHHVNLLLVQAMTSTPLKCFCYSIERVKPSAVSRIDETEDSNSLRRLSNLASDSLK